jgi:hypothetical protein
MTLKITVTDAGRAALVNAGNTGTLPVTVDKIGVTATAFVPTTALTALPGQLKQLSTFGGAAVAADTIHAIIRDDSADTYSLFGFGLFLADGTLFGVYGQATAILEKSSLAMLLLATDIIFADIDAASITFGDTNFLNPPATTDVQGVVELATDAETITGTDAIRAVTPKSVKAVLDDRLGAAAPTSFVKTLLNKVTTLAFVTALGIRGAASFDTGTGNGLDADLLDGQHGAYYLDWDNFANKPPTFTPSAHNHSASEITSGTLAVARGGTGAGTFTAGSYLLGNGTGAFGVKTPAQVLTDIGAAPVIHSHAIADVNGLQTALDARPVQTSVTAQITAAVNALVNGSPGALDTLKELADAMGDDANFAATVTNALALRALLSGADFTGNLTTSTGFRSSGNPTNPTAWTGGGVEVYYYTDNTGQILCYDRSTATYKSLLVRGSDVTLQANGVNICTAHTGGLVVNGSVIASGGYQLSDRRAKHDIEPRAVDTSLAAKLVPLWSQWLRNSDNGFDTGTTAQDMLLHAPQFVKVPEDPEDMLAIDKAGAALECALGADIRIDQLLARIEALEAHAS